MLVRVVTSVTAPRRGSCSNSRYEMSRHPEYDEAVQGETRRCSILSGIPAPLTEFVIDDRNERPLTIALATIIMVWSFAFALTFASGHTGANSASWLSGAAAVTSSTGK